MNNYTIYHLHTMLSNGVTNIDSITDMDEYINRAAELGMKAMAFSEHGSIFSWVKKKQHIESKGMKYIHSQEFYITESLEEKVRDNYHCILIAKNYDGVKELNKLSSLAFNKEDGHFYYNPRITMSELENTTDDIIITTACLASPLSKGTDSIKKRMLKFVIDNKHRCFLEVQHHCDEEQIKYNRYLLELSRKYNIPLIAGTDTHALNEDHMSTRAILQKSKNVKFDNEDSWDMVFKTYEELISAYKLQNSIPEKDYMSAIENTNVMADMVEEFELDYSHKYPKLYNNSLDVLKSKIKQGVINKGIHKYPDFKRYKERINYELKTYIHNGAVDFLLLEEDYKSALKKQGVHCGYSRGSVSGSVIAYILGITDVDSVKYNLNFERFMNPERISLADVDSDFYKGDRWKIREYLFQRDGLYCCDIITFNTIKLRGAIDDICRAYEIPLDEVDCIKKTIQEDENGNEFVPEDIKNKYKDIFNHVELAMGTVVSVGNHPAGLVVSPHNVQEAFGTFYSSEDKYPISQINMKDVDGLNYVKLDILGLDAVGLINQTCEFADIDYITPDNIDFNDESVWKSISEDTTLIFQFESDFAGDYLKKCLSDNTISKIKSVNPNFSKIDIMSMANGAVRPAGASYRDELSNGIYRDNGNKELNDFLAPTLGYLVYQCQIIEFLNKFCGFTMGEADVVRRHFAKKTGTEQDIPIIKDGGYLNEGHYIKGFISTMKEVYNIEKEESEKIIISFLQVIEDASSYLFSLNHAQPYSFIGYVIGWLRYYYPLETLTAALNIYADDAAKSNNIKQYIYSKGIKINTIKFRYSRSEYFFDKPTNTIYQGISSIKYMNSIIADELFSLKDNQYNSFIDLLVDIDNTSINSRQLNILICLDMFSEFGEINQLLTMTEIFDKYYGKKQIKKANI
ncbi:MAG: PHP domain-containing protein, partial [Pseudobutyrivibrio sp.]|nr:PHP domain-containing protein [Pseudobutyrivibrio sp.]